MFAFEIPNQRFSLPAGMDVMRHRLVTVDEGSVGVVTDNILSVIGVSMNEAPEGQVLEIADGLVMVEAGGAIAAGDTIAADAEGRAIAGESMYVAITAASAAGELITVKI